MKTDNNEIGKNTHEKSVYETIEDNLKKAIFGVLYLLLQDEESSMF